MLMVVSPARSTLPQQLYALSQNLAELPFDLVLDAYAFLAAFHVRSSVPLKFAGISPDWLTFLPK